MSRLTGRCPRCDCRYPLHIHAGPFPKTTGDVLEEGYIVAVDTYNKEPRDLIPDLPEGK
jgi:hypothetical protein